MSTPPTDFSSLGSTDGEAFWTLLAELKRQHQLEFEQFWQSSSQSAIKSVALSGFILERYLR